MKTSTGLLVSAWLSSCLLAAAQTFSVHQYPTGAGPTQIIRSDFNGDGIPDLATLNVDGNSISILLGKGDGTFRLPIGTFVGNHPISMVTTDLNRDGKKDVVTVNRATDP